MNHSKSRHPLSRSSHNSVRRREARTVVHAGDLLLAKRNGTAALERYLARDDRREFFLIHHGQSSLHEVAEAVGVRDVELDEVGSACEAERATRLAVAMDADDLEFTIARPALTTFSGTPIAEIPCSEAEQYANDPSLRSEIQNKIHAACEAVRAGIRRVRIGNPTALFQDRATTIVPDSTIALAGAVLPDVKRQSDPDPPRPDRDPEMHPIELPRPERPEPLPALAPRRIHRRRLRFSPRWGCQIGTGTPAPFRFPTDRILPPSFDRWHDRRLRRYA